MTGSLRGVVEQVDAGSVRLRLGAVAVDVLVPPVVAQALVARTGESVELEVVVYLQGAGMTGFRPVTFGFATALERQLFELLTTVDGVGPRAALRMLAEPAEVVGRAIAAADAEVLKRLPGVGEQRAAELIARLQNKVRRLCGGGGEPAPAEPAAEGLGTRGQNPWEEEVLAVLLQLGYRPAEARSLIRSVGARRPAPRDVEEALRTILAEGGRWS